jgi:REP element-mobilizing transposase RayT
MEQISNLRNTRRVRFWQRNYYERVIRDDDELNRLRRYVLDNPVQWEGDEDNPVRPAGVESAAHLTVIW